MKKRTLTTPYKEHLDVHQPWQDYPRPQLKRNSYLNLNGKWDYKISKNKNFPSQYDGEIVVPFVMESPLSLVNKTLKKGEFLFYRKLFTLPADFRKELVLLHFGGVDQIADVYINSKHVITNQFGYIPFEVDITAFLTQSANELIVRVKDNLDQNYPYGKQRKKRGGMWYTPISGIWQTVWLESVNKGYIKGLKITPNIDTSEVEIVVDTEAVDKTITVYDDYQNIIITKQFSGPGITLTLDHPQLWSPESPHLYYFDIQTPNDKVSSYFAMRKFSIGTANGYKYLFLNNQPYFFNGLLDQGYFSDGIYLPPTIEGFVDDITKMKELGFNTLRKHIKIEPLLWYYLCDKLGMVVWQDFVNNSPYSFVMDSLLPFLGKTNLNEGFKFIHKKAKRIFQESMKKTVSLLYNTPSIGYWTIFNEGWGQFNSQENYGLLKTLDSTRIIDTNSGWFDQGHSDVKSLHVYFREVTLPKSDKPLVLSEFGGYSYKLNDHSFNLDKTYGYRFFDRQETYEESLIRLYENEIIPNIKKGLSGAIYTQVSDVEDETNGLLTYDRKVLKVNKEKLSVLNQKLKI